MARSGLEAAGTGTARTGLPPLLDAVVSAALNPASDETGGEGSVPRPTVSAIPLEALGKRTSVSAD